MVLDRELLNGGWSLLPSSPPPQVPREALVIVILATSFADQGAGFLRVVNRSNV